MVDKFSAEEHGGLVSVWKNGILQSLEREIVTTERLTGNRPRRKFHLEPPTPEQVAEFDAWKEQWQRLTQQGWDNGWLGSDYDGTTEPIEQAPRQVVYDETEEAFQTRLETWRAAQPKGTVSFPVRNRPSTVTAIEPTIEELNREADAHE